MSVNSLGFRDSPTEHVKKLSGLRIVGIGDSVMFGWGVSDSETYLSTLAKDLKQVGCKSDVEVINSAVPGYNTVMAVETLDAKMLKWNPDIVIYNYVRNDLYLPSFIRKKNPIFSFDYSFLLRAIKRKLENSLSTDYRLDRPTDSIRNESYIGEEEKIPEEYQNLVGLPAFRVAIEKIAELAEINDFLPIIFSQYIVQNEVLNVFSQLGLPVLNSYPQATKYLERLGYNNYLGSPLTISDTDRHPSVIYHRIISKYLAHELVKTRWCM